MFGHGGNFGAALAGGPREGTGGTGFVLAALGVQVGGAFGIADIIPSSTEVPQRFTLCSMSFFMS